MASYKSEKNQGVWRYGIRTPRSIWTNSLSRFYFRGALKKNSTPPDIKFIAFSAVKGM
jgi:hypothetical protein